MLRFILTSFTAFVFTAFRFRSQNKTIYYPTLCGKTWQSQFFGTNLWSLGLLVSALLSVTQSFFSSNHSQAPFVKSGFEEFILLIVVIGIIWFLIKLFGSSGSAEGRDTSYGSAEWTRYQILKNAGIYDLPEQRKEFLYIGSASFNTKKGHLISIASSRAGKGASMIVTNLLLPNSDSFVVIDIKGENAYMTVRYQAGVLGKKVYILDPWDEQGAKGKGATHGVAASGFNPLDFIKSNPDELIDNCGLVAEMIVPVNPASKEPFFDNSARAMIKTYLMHLLTAYPEADHNLWTIYKWLRLDSEERLTLWAEMKVNDALDGLIGLAAGEFIHFSDGSNTFASVLTSAHDATRFLNSRHLRKSLCQSGFNPYDLPKGDTVVYIILPERYLKQYAFWMRLVVGLSLRACNHRPKERVNFLLDEMPILGKLDDLETGYAFAAGQNIRLWSFVQNLGQIETLYGKGGLSSFMSCQMLQAFLVDDLFSAEIISKLLGDTTIVVKNTSTSSGKEGSSSSTSYNKTGRALMTAEEIMKTDRVINFYRDGKQKYKFEGEHWMYFEPAPYIHQNHFLGGSFANLSKQFMSHVDLLPEHRDLQEPSLAPMNMSPQKQKMAA